MSFDSFLELLISRGNGPKNDEQLAALTLLCTTKKNIYLAGPGGTGKSWVIGAFRQFLEEKCVDLALLAPTGVAAINIGGQTLNRFFGIGAPVNSQEALRNFSRNDKAAARVKGVHVVIIDEISMVSAWCLDALEEIARRARGNDSPWGSLRVIVVGDFLQLSPVPSRVKDAPAAMMAFTSSAWDKSNFVASALTQNVRVKAGERELTDCLLDARVGDRSARLKELIHSRANIRAVDSDIPRLLSERKDVAAYNFSKLAELSGTQVDYQTTYWSHDNEPQTQLEGYFPIPARLTLKIGARVMFRINDPGRAGRFVNGTVGILRSIDQGGAITTIGVSDGAGVEVTIEPVTFEMKNIKGDVVATAKNFPVDLAWAITIHKSQGMTLDNAVVDLTKVFASGQAYVGMSRLSKIDGLYLVGDFPDSVYADPLALKFMMGLQSGAIAGRMMPDADNYGFVVGQNYALSDICRQCGNPDNESGLIRMCGGRATFMLIRPDYNPAFNTDHELWIHDKSSANSRRLEQVFCLARTERSVPAFVADQSASNNIKWKFAGMFCFDSYSTEPGVVNAHVAGRIVQPVSTVVWLERV
jgi:ATP-dependent DNA helicase PIF1